MRIKYRYMMQVVRGHQQQAESAAAALIARLQSQPESDAVHETQALAAQVLQLWSALPDALILQFADGYNTPTYPDWWLKAVGYGQGPPPPEE